VSQDKKNKRLKARLNFFLKKTIIQHMEKNQEVITKYAITQVIDLIEGE